MLCCLCRLVDTARLVLSAKPVSDRVSGDSDWGETAEAVDSQVQGSELERGEKLTSRMSARL